MGDSEERTKARVNKRTQECRIEDSRVMREDVRIEGKRTEDCGSRDEGR